MKVLTFHTFHRLQSMESAITGSKEEEMSIIGEFGQGVPISRPTKPISAVSTANSERRLFLCGKPSFKLCQPTLPMMLEVSQSMKDITAASTL